MTKVSKFISKQGALIALIVLCIIAAVRYPIFTTGENLYNLLRQNSMIGLIAVAMSMVILTGGIDLSVGAVCAMVSVIAARFTNFMPSPLIIILPLLIGTLFGTFNGVVVAKFGVAPIISSLGVQLIARGVSLVITSGETEHLRNAGKEWMPEVAKLKLAGMPVIFIIFAVFAVIFIFVLKYTEFGRSIYAVGGNEDAARMMGMRPERIKILVYTISGFASALAGIILVCRVGSGQPVACDGWEMDAIAATAIGGTSLAGGRGGIVGTIFGVFILAVIGNMINLQGNINSWWQSIITGLLLIAVLMLQVLTQRRRVKKA